MDIWLIAPHNPSMAAVLFDTLRLSRTLRDKGHFTPEQAETLAEAFSDATHEDLATKADFLVLEAAFKSEFGIVKAELSSMKAEIANLATKAELAEVKAELKTDISELRTELAGVKADILKWMVGAIGFQTVATLGTVIALVRIFAK